MGLIWGLNYGLWQLAGNPETALYYSRGLMLGAIPLSLFFLWFSLVYLGLIDKYMPLLIAFGVATVFFWFADFTPYFVASVEPRGIFPYWPTPGILFHPFLFLWFAGFLTSWVELLLSIFRTTGMRRNQSVYILGLTLGVIIFGGVNNYLLWYNINVPPYGNFVIPFYPLLMTYLILKYQLMDIKVAIRKSLVYSSVIVVISMVYLLTIYLVSEYFGQFTKNNLILNLLALVFFALLLQPVRDWVQHYVDLRFDRKKTDYQEGLVVAAKVSRSFTNLTSSIMVMVHTLMDKMGLAGAGFFLFESESGKFEAVEQGGVISADRPLIQFVKERKAIVVREEVEEHFDALVANAATTLEREALMEDFEELHCQVIVPCFNDEILEGFFSLGAKKSGDQFSREDLQFLDSISGFTAMTVENALLLAKERTIAQQIAQEKAASVVQTAVTFNHEINNPLTVIMSNAEILQSLTENNAKLEPNFLKERMQLIAKETMKIKSIMGRMERLTRPVVKEYLPGTAMLDLTDLEGDQKC